MVGAVRVMVGWGTALLVLLGMSTGAAQAATGSLTFAATESGQATLNGARGVAVSPDGRSVYVAGQDADAVVAYARSESGALTNIGCVKDTAALAICSGSTDGLDSPRFIAVSPDNRFVYVSGGGDRAVVIFSRDTSSGALTPAGCWKDTTSSATCGDTATGIGGALNGAEGIAIAPDGTNLYVAGQDNDTVVTFNRDVSSGALSSPSCIKNTGSSANCGTTINGLDAPRELAISPDGGGVYVAAATSNDIAAFSRGAGGALTSAGAATGVLLPVGVAVSPDSSQVYAGAVNSRAIRVFNRDKGSSALTPADCAKDDGAAAVCGAVQEGLAGVEGVAVAPDGLSVYGAGAVDNAVAALSRDTASGALSPLGCVRNAPAGSCESGSGLGGAHGVAVSPDGKNVYVTGFSDDSIVTLNRETPPAPPDEEQPTDEFGRPLPADPSAPATAISLLLGGKTVVVAGGRRGVQVRTNGTCDADLFQTEGQTLTPENQPLFKRTGLTIKKAGTYILPITLTAAGVKQTEKSKKALAVRSALSCASQRYPAADTAGFGTGASVTVTPKPNPGVKKAVQVSLLDQGDEPGAIPDDQEFRVRWKASGVNASGSTVTFDVVDNKRVENFRVAGGQANCIAVSGAQAPKKADFIEFQTEKLAIDKYGQTDLNKSLAVPGDQIRRAQVHINFNEASVGKDTAGGVVKFDFRAGDGGCGMLVTFTAKPERIEVPAAQRVEYGGRTEKDDEVTFNLAAGKRLDDLRIELPLTCRSNSDIFGQRSFSMTELFTADSVAIKDGRFNATVKDADSFITLSGTVSSGRVDGFATAGRTFANGTTDFLTCGTAGDVTFTAKPGKPEAKKDKDSDGVPDSQDKCPTLSDAGDPRKVRDGCPAGSPKASGTPSLSELLKCNPPKAKGSFARAAALTPEQCDQQKVVEAFEAYASALSDSVVEQWRLSFVEKTVPLLAAEADRGALQAYARDIYAAYRLPMRNLLRQSIVILTPPDIGAVSAAFRNGPLTERRPDFANFGAPDCSKFRPDELVVECKAAYSDVAEAVCNAGLELYRVRFDLARKRLWPGRDWTEKSGRFGPVAPEARCNLPRLK